jgi:hypothetical protein
MFRGGGNRGFLQYPPTPPLHLSLNKSIAGHKKGLKPVGAVNQHLSQWLFSEGERDVLLDTVSFRLGRPGNNLIIVNNNLTRGK